MKLIIDALCNIGVVRQNNEDGISIGGAFFRDDSTSMTVDIPSNGCFSLLLSDGMGGHENGEEASQITLANVSDLLSSHEFTADNFEDLIREEVHRTSLKLNNIAKEQEQTRPMGCTLTGVVILNEKVWLINAGDSRTYRFRDNMLRLLTVDETERGITGNPFASKLLLNCIGGGAQGHLNIEEITHKLINGDTLLICSDGLSDMVTNDDIETALSQGKNSADLLEMACAAGGQDNVSIILAKVIL